MLLSIAGTRPLPAVSVPSASHRRPIRPPPIPNSVARIGAAAHRIVRDAGERHADQAGGELIEIGLADDDCAGRAVFATEVASWLGE
jgi:hypothetical protein